MILRPSQVLRFGCCLLCFSLPPSLPPCTRRVVLAVGHSARPVYERLLDSGVSLQAKGIAVGFRIEHPQVNIYAGTRSRPSRSVPCFVAPWASKTEAAMNVCGECRDDECAAEQRWTMAWHRKSA